MSRRTVFELSFDDIFENPLRKNKTWEVSEKQVAEFDKGINYTKLINEALITTFPRNKRKEVAQKLNAAFGDTHHVYMK